MERTTTYDDCLCVSVVLGTGTLMPKAVACICRRPYDKTAPLFPLEWESAGQNARCPSSAQRGTPFSKALKERRCRGSFGHVSSSTPPLPRRPLIVCTLLVLQCTLNEAVDHAISFEIAVEEYNVLGLVAHRLGNLYVMSNPLTFLCRCSPGKTAEDFVLFHWRFA